MKKFTAEQLEARRARALAWNTAHRDRYRQNKKAYYLKNRERLAKQAAEYGRTHKRDNQKRCAEFQAARPWYNSWQLAKQRCNNPKNPRWKFYGGRGIKCLLAEADVKLIWERDEAAKLSHPTLERIDNNGGYVLDNCRFVERWDDSSIAAMTRRYGGRTY